MKNVILLALVACGGGDGAAISIDGAPQISLTEGELTSVAISIEPAPGSGDCAAPLEAGSLVAAIDGRDAPDVFDVFSLRADAGGLVLDMEPRCDLMGPGEADVLFELTVSSPSGCAREAAARLQIASAPATGCGPRVLAWSGDCSVAPAGAGSSVAIPATPDPDPLCVSFRSRDPGRETLAIRSDTNFPGHIVAAADLPIADGVAESALFSIPITDTSNLAGVYTLDHFVFLGDAAAGATADFAGVIAIEVGDADLAIDVPPQLEPVDELSIQPIPVRLWGPGRDGPVPLCARATRVDPGFAPLPRTRSFLRIDNPLTGDASTDGFVCGDDLRLAVSPPVDALPVEQVLIEAAYCDGCDDTPAPLTAPVTRLIDIETESLVEQTSCPGDLSASIDLACADLAGDGTPELLFRSRGGASPRTCVFAGDRGRLVPVPLAVGSTEVPVHIGQLIWRDPDDGPTPVILGRFAVAPLIRRLSIGAEAVWSAAIELGIDAVDTRIDLSAPLAADLSGGATHLARFDAARQGIEITCVAPNDPVITDCADLSLPGLLTSTANFRGIAGLDLDGDGDLDLVAYEGDGAGESAIRIHAFRLSWPDPGAPVVDESFSTNTGLDAEVVAIATDRDPTCSIPPCREQAFAVHQGSGHGNGLAHFSRLLSGPLTDLDGGIEPTLGPTRGAAGAAGLALAATAYGLWVPRAVGTADTSFQLADPVLIEERQLGPEEQQGAAYGVDVAACPGAAVPSFAVVVSPAEARLVRRDVVVESF